MVIFLVGLVSMILMRTLRKDYARYSKEEEMDDMVSKHLYFIYKNNLSQHYFECWNNRSTVLRLDEFQNFQVLKRYKTLGGVSNQILIFSGKHKNVHPKWDKQIINKLC